MDYKTNMVRKIILGIVALVCISVSVQAGIGILESAELGGTEISCPQGVPNCSHVAEEAEAYSDTGTQNFVLKLLGGVLNFAALVAVLMLVIASIRLVIAMGSQESLQSAKKHILWSLGGLAIIILSLVIVRNVTEKIYEAAQDCLTVPEDGVYRLSGDVTARATEEAPQLAESWCVDKWKDNIFDQNVLEFQKEFNQLQCGEESTKWLRIDAASETGADCSEPEDCTKLIPKNMKIPDSCYTGDLEAQSEKAGCEALKDLKPICDAMQIAAVDCTIAKIQETLGATADGTSRPADNYYYEPSTDPKQALADSCSKSDGLYGGCTKQALQNYFEANGCDGSAAPPPSSTPSDCEEDGKKLVYLADSKKGKATLYETVAGSGEYSGTYTNDKGVSYLNTYTGEFDDQCMVSGSGKQTIDSPDGDKVVYEGGFKDGKYHGSGVLTYTSQKNNSYVYEGEFNNDKRLGDGKQTFTSGSPKGMILEGSWSNDKLVDGSRYSPGKSKFVGTFNTSASQLAVAKKGTLEKLGDPSKKFIFTGDFNEKGHIQNGKLEFIEQEVIREGKFENSKISEGSVTYKKSDLKLEGTFDTKTGKPINAVGTIISTGSPAYEYKDGKMIK